MRVPRSRRINSAKIFMEEGTRLCKACFDRLNIKKWDAAANLNKGRGFPSLTGTSHRQVLWAEWIRDLVFNTTGNALECYEQTLASWWIVNYHSHRWTRFGYSHTMHMTDEQSSLTKDEEDLHRDMVAFAKKLAKDPKAALGFLQRAGIVTSLGALSPDYGGSIRYEVSAENGAFVARCLDDVEVASEGDTLEEAVANLQEAFRER
mgnify:CR=1 FL=1